VIGSSTIALTHPLTFPEFSQGRKSDLPFVAREFGLAREWNLPQSARLVPHREFTKAAELDGEAIQIKIVEKCFLNARHDHIHQVFRFLLRSKAQPRLNSGCQFVPTSS
jgi:hypothetical protein